MHYNNCIRCYSTVNARYGNIRFTRLSQLDQIKTTVLRAHARPLPQQLHWLPVSSRVQYKLFTVKNAWATVSGVTLPALRSRNASYQTCKTRFYQLIVLLHALLSALGMILSVVCLSVMLCIVALRVVVGVESCTAVFLAGYFLYTSSDTFAVGYNNNNNNNNNKRISFTWRKVAKTTTTSRNDISFNNNNCYRLYRSATAHSEQNESPKCPRLE